MLFDPEGIDYDYKSAQDAGYRKNEKGHWSSVDHRSGMILKGRGHPTWEQMVEEEDSLGNKVVKIGGRYYSVSKDRYKNNRGNSMKSKYKYGGDNPILDFRSRQDEYLIKIKDEGYNMSRHEKDELLSTYNTDMYAMMNKLYQEPRETKTNETTKYVQEFLSTVNYYHDKIDGLYGKNTKASIKKYLFDHGGKQLFNAMKDKAESIFE